MSRSPGPPELLALALGDPPERWRALGFALAGDRLFLGGVGVRLGAPGQGIAGWRVAGIEREVDGLASIEPLPPPSGPGEHPNGALGIDHLVVLTPDFGRTSTALEAAAIPLRRVVRRPDGARMGFRRLGPAILELVEAADAPAGPARFWGIAVAVADLDALAGRLGAHLGAIAPALQPGRRIATLRRSAGLGQPVAFIEPG